MPNLVIDHRENALKDYFNDVDLEWRLLPLGDIIVEHEGNPILIIERKNVKDLAASIKDGRYKSQKNRLLDTYDKSQICYIIEGDICYSEHQNVLISGITIDIIHSCIINTMLRDGIVIFHTKNVKDTCDLIKQIYKRYMKDPQKYMKQGGSTNNDIAIKSHNVTTKRDCYIAQLCQIPGISNKTAEVIANKYSDMNTLLEAIKNMGVSAFQEIKTEKNRALNKNVINNVITFMT